MVQEVSRQIALGESSVAKKRLETFSIICKDADVDSCKTLQSLKFGHNLPTEPQKILKVNPTRQPNPTAEDHPQDFGTRSHRPPR